MLKLICSALLLCVASTLLAQTDSTQKKILISTKGDTIDIRNDPEKIYIKVEKEAEFPGGLNAWREFLQDNLTYPRQAVRQKIQGTVVIQFIVCTDGTVCDVEAISGPEELRKTAVDAFKKTPSWIPAKQDGRQVKSYKAQPIVFSIPN